MYPKPKKFQNQPCSRGCVYNWINYGQKPNPWQSCQCCKKMASKIKTEVKCQKIKYFKNSI